VWIVFNIFEKAKIVENLSCLIIKGDTYQGQRNYCEYQNFDPINPLHKSQIEKQFGPIEDNYAKY